MRTLKLQVQVGLDGSMAGPDGEMDWMTGAWTADMDAYVDALTDPVDCIVLGRRLAEGFIPHWAAQPADEPQEAIDKINGTPKVVISDTPSESPWDNAIVAGGDLRETITKLKAQEGGDMIVYGGGTLVSSLIAEALIDELHLFVNPTAIGAGMPVFRPSGYEHLRLVDAHPFDCGITALHLAPMRG